MGNIYLPLLLLCSLSLVACTSMEIKPPLNIPADSNVKPTYSWLRQNVFGKICAYCHGTRQPYLLVYESIQTVVEPGKPLDSKLYYMVATGQMPKGGKLSEDKKWAIYQWIKNGAKDD